MGGDIGYSSKYKGIIHKENLQNPKKYADDREIVFRSKLEYDFFLIFDRNSAFKKWASETLAIPYANPLKQNQISRYFPDILLEMSLNGSIINYLVEIKPQSELDALINIGTIRKNTKQFFRAIQNKAKWEAACAWCKNESERTGKQWQFIVLTEKDLKNLKGP